VIRDGKTVCRKTPCKLELPADTGDIELRVERRGYRTGKVRIATGESKSYDVALRRRRVHKPPPRDDREPRPPEDFLEP
jgi:hypothetical protein